MNKIGSHFDPKKILPENIIIKSSGTHLYKTGLSPFKNGSIVRNRFHNPLVFSLINFMLFFKCLLSIKLTEDKYQVIIGDVFYFVDMKIHGNIFLASVAFLSLISQFIHYHNYKNKINPSFLKPFDMMSGLVSPKSIGLTNKEDIYKLLDRFRTLVKFFGFIHKMVLPSFGSIGYFISCSFKSSLKEAIIYGIPHSILWGVFMYYMYISIIWHFLYFYIICYYVKIKIRQINKNLAKICAYNYIKIIPNMKSLNKIYLELSDFNDIFWSKFLFWFWITFIVIIVMLLYATLFGQMILFLRLIAIQLILILISILISIINIASSVNLEANKSYKLLNSCMTFIDLIESNTNLKLIKYLLSH